MPFGARVGSDRAHAAIIRRPASGRRRRAAGGAPSLLRSSAVPDRAVAMAEGVEWEDALVTCFQPLHLARVTVEERAEAPDDVAAPVVLHLLHLAHDRRALGPVGGHLRLVVQ